MIPVQQQPEPKSFGKNVRTPGARWLNGLALPPQNQKEWKGHEYWHKCLNDLYACYFSNGEVRPNDKLPVDEKIKVDETIKILKLNASEITRKRAEDFSAYIAGMVTLEYLVKYSPFVAEEITRQHLELA